MSTGLRPGLPPLPARMRALPLDGRGYPIPWFVAEIDGKRDFRVADGKKRARAVRERLCWVCGEAISAAEPMAFVIGPMCAVNRNTSEPGCHHECATFAVLACPFMTRPKADYRRANMPEESQKLPHGIDGNPGAACIWSTYICKPYDVQNTFLIHLGEPYQVEWFCEGQPASREQILESMQRRLPELEKMAKAQGAGAEEALIEAVEIAKLYLPAAAGAA